MRKWLLALVFAATPFAAHAAAYQLATGGVIREADHAFIPDDPNNRDWVAYQKWLAVPNSPDPSATPTAAQIAQAKAYSDLAAKIAAGLAITSTGTPALDATYPLDAATQSQIQGIQLYIAAHGRFPAGLSSLPVVDINGVAHTIPSVTEYTAWVTAIADNLTAVILQAHVEAAGGTPSWPAATATIP